MEGVKMRVRFVRAKWMAGVAVLCIGLTGCPDEGGPGGGNETLDVSLTLSASTVLALQDGTPAPVSVTITRYAGEPNSLALTATGLPAGMLAQFDQRNGSRRSGPRLVASGAAPAGTYAVSIQA